MTDNEPTGINPEVLDEQTMDPGVNPETGPEDDGEIPKKGLHRDPGAQFRRILVRGLIATYLILVILLGYWYWLRPVRVDQISRAYAKWHSLADIYKIPTPVDERWLD